MRRRFQRRFRRRCQDGSALVELAVLTPVMSILLLGSIWFGYTFYTYNQLEKSIHDAGRYASTRSMLDTADGRAIFTDAVKNVAVYGLSGNTTSYPVVPNLAPANVNVVLEGPANARPISVRVEVVNYSVPGLFGTIAINKPVTRFPYIGAYYVDVDPTAPAP